MSSSKLINIIFGIAFMVLLYVIIFYALKIMYKDVKTGGKRRQGTAKKNYGIEVLKVGENSNLEEGTILLLRGPITIGRKESNIVQLTDQFASGDHARLDIKNNEVYIEDLNSTNGIFINEEKIEQKAKLRPNDKIRIGSAIFKVIKSDKK